MSSTNLTVIKKVGLFFSSQHLLTFEEWILFYRANGKNLLFQITDLKCISVCLNVITFLQITFSIE